MSCVECGRPVEADWDFCRWCGTPVVAAASLGRICASCGSPLSRDDRFCGSCGTPVPEFPDGTTPESPAAAAPVPLRLGRGHARPVMLALAGVLALLAGVAGGFALSGRSLPFLGGGGAAVAADTTDAEDAIPAASPSRAPTSTEGTDQTSPATASTMIPTTADTTTSTTLADMSSSTSTTVPGDLDLSVPMARPECDGSYATFIGASVTPEDYGSEISGYLERYPDSNYLRTDITCSSLRSRTEDGEIIYAVFLGPFDTFDQACSATSRGPAGSYVKRLDDVSDPNEIPEC